MSSRNAEMRADSKLLVSIPTSRWLMMDDFDSKVYSIGSSMVMMCSVRVWLIRSIIEASVVDFPCPTGPTTRKNPCSSWQNVSSAGGSLSSSNDLISLGMSLRAIDVVPCWKNAFPRKRTPGVFAMEPRYG